MNVRRERRTSREVYLTLRMTRASAKERKGRKKGRGEREGRKGEMGKTKKRSVKNWGKIGEKRSDGRCGKKEEIGVLSTYFCSC